MQSTEGRVYRRPESRFYWIEFRDRHGRKIRRSAQTTREEEAWKRLRREQTLSVSLSFREAVVDFFQVHSRNGNLRPKTLSGYATSLRNVDPFLGNKTLEEIDREVLKELIQSRRQSVKDATVRRDLAFVSTVFSHAIDTMPGAPSHNPVLSIRKRHLKEHSRTRWLRPQEYERLLNSCTQEHHRIIIKTAVHTGMRHGELVALRKPMIDFKRREVTLDVDLTKGRRERVIPICAWLCAELEEHCARLPGDLVFAYPDPLTGEWKPYTEFSNFWKAARRRAELEDVRFHDLRHTFGSWWAQAGGDILTLRDVLGHTSLQMVQRYAHLNTAAHHTQIRKVFAHTLDTVQNK